MKYRKKPIVIEAIKWDSSNLLAWLSTFKDGHEKVEVKNINEIIVHTLEGDMLANVGDYIIRGIKGEFYPCKADIFEATYEKVEDEI